MDKKAIILIILFIAIIIVGINVFSYYHKHNFNLYVLNAGKADCAILYYRDKTIVIDTGEEDFYTQLSNHLRKNNRNRIDTLIITHFDKDHVGSASKLIDNFDIGEVFITNTIKESEYYTNFINSMNNHKYKATIVKNDALVYSDDKLNITVNGPDKLYAYDESNNSSLIVSIDYVSKRFLFMGDALNERMKDYMETHDGTYDVIKLPHHGDYLKQDEELIKKYNPRTVIVSSDYIDEKLKSLISKYNLTMHYTNDVKEYKFSEV